MVNKTTSTPAFSPTKCEVCGGGYSKINRTPYDCSAAKNKGDAVCSNRRTIKREILE